MKERETVELLLDELINYYNADVLPSPASSLTDGDFHQSAGRLVAYHGERAADVAALLLELSTDASNPLFETIERTTLYHWNGTPEDWATFQRLAVGVSANVSTRLRDTPPA